MIDLDKRFTKKSGMSRSKENNIAAERKLQKQKEDALSYNRPRQRKI